MRRFVILSLILAGVASRADACYPCWCPPLPMCCWVYEAAPRVLVYPSPLVPQAMPATAVPASPKVQFTPPRPLTTETIPPAKAAAPVKEPIRPATFDADVPRSKPTPSAELRPPSAETIPPLKVAPPIPKFEIPLPEAPKLESPALPGLVLPKSPEVPPPSPKLEIPPPATEPLTLPVPKSSKEKPSPPLPDLVLPPPAIPTPAPAPVEPAQFLPLDSPKLPLPETKLSDTGLPPLALPPVSLPKVTAQASPLSGVRSALPRVRQIPVAAATHSAPLGKRKVGFFNYTQSPLELVIEGETVTLPRRSYLQAEVPATFAWRLGPGEARHVTIPSDQAGIEMVIE